LQIIDLGFRKAWSRGKVVRGRRSEYRGQDRFIRELEN
jgi:hypothetical protein